MEQLTTLRYGVELSIRMRYNMCMSNRWVLAIIILSRAMMAYYRQILLRMIRIVMGLAILKNHTLALMDISQIPLILTQTGMD